MSNLVQQSIDFTKSVHIRENTQQNENHLNANRQKFTGQCAIVLSLLQRGHVISSYTAMTQWHIGHLPRRIKDLRDNEKTPVHIDEKFEMTADGKATRNKIWFIKEFLSEETKQKFKIT